MQNKQRFFVMLGLAVLVAVGIIVFGVMRTADGGSGSSDSGNIVWIILMTQIPIMVSVFAAKQESRKKKKKKQKHHDTVLQSAHEDEIDYQNAVLSSYDGEIVTTDELQSHGRRN